MKLYVGNLAFETTENDLQDLFEQHGTVNEVHLMMDRMTGKSRGFAFVTMNDDEQAKSAMSATNGKELNGRALNVNEARPREERGGNRPNSGGPRRNFSGFRR
jgi:RNA recognition motif-containing protein